MPESKLETPVWMKGTILNPGTKDMGIQKVL
jgi:hypothetical protein